MLLFIGYMELMKRFMPPPEGEVGDEQAVVEQVDPQDPQQQEDQPVPAANVDGEAEAELAEADPAVVTDEVEVAPAEQTWLTIGSLDPTSGYTMLVTFNNQGAAVERIELNHPHYKDLEDKSAYIGHLALTEGASGAQVNVVGHGTPAAVAGIQVGDEISAVGDESVATPASVALALQNYKYGESVPLTVVRDGASIQISVASIRRPLEVVRPERIPEAKDGENLHVGELQPLSYLVSLFQLGHKRADFTQQELPNLPSLRSEHWHASISRQGETTTVEFRFTLPPSALAKADVRGDGPLEVVKRFWLPRHEGSEFDEDKAAVEGRNYHLNFDLEFVNQGTQDLEIGYRIEGPTGLPLEGWWYSFKTHPTKWGGAGMRDVVWQSDIESHKMFTNPSITKHAENNPQQPGLVVVETPQKLQYLGVDAQYFNSSLLPATQSEDAQQSVVLEKVELLALSGTDKRKSTRTPVTFRADSSVLMLPGDQSSTQKFEIFAGPKHPDVLAEYGLGQCIVYGWFKFFAKVMAWLLHMLYGVVGNYGVAIILLTVIVRACMFPIGRQQAKSAKVMQELAPEIKKIKEKYPNDTEKQTKAQQELFRKHNYNPLAGCAPMFLQLPIFIGLYRALSVDIELRQTPLLQGMEWCNNLAAPDMLWHWSQYIPIQSLTGYTGFLGPYLNILPLFSTCLILIQQQLFTPPAADEQQEMQQRIMKFMMLFMLVIFFKVPAGLCLYFITSSLWALGERLMLPKDDKQKSSSEPESAAARSSRVSEATAKLFNREEPAKETAAERKKRRKKKRKA